MWSRCGQCIVVRRKLPPTDDNIFEVWLSYSPWAHTNLNSLITPTLRQRHILTVTTRPLGLRDTTHTHTRRQRYMHVLTHILHWPVRHSPHTLADTGWVTRKCRRVDLSSQGPVGLLSSCQAYTQTYISTHSQNHTWSWTKNGRQIELLNSQNSIERMADFHKTHSSSTHALHLLCLFVKQVCYSNSVLHLYWKHFSGFTFFVDFWFLILKHFIYTSVATLLKCMKWLYPYVQVIVQRVFRSWVWHPYQTFNLWCQQLKIQESFPLPF